MSKPRHLYEICEREFVAHSDDGKLLVLQHAHPIHSEDRARDMSVYVSRADAPRVIEAIERWLAETT